LRLEESSVKQADIRRERGSQCDLRQASVHIAASPCLGRDVASHLLNHESLITNQRVSNRHKVPIRNRRNSLKTNDRRLFYPSLKRGACEPRFWHQNRIRFPKMNAVNVN
jgi:hypothetical protein